MGGARLTGFLLDTHIWWWYLTGSDRLPRGLLETIDASAADCWLSPISVWETGMLAARGRIRIPGAFRLWMEQAMTRFPVNEAPINREVALASLEVELRHKDPADRLIAATALVYDLTLLTVDERLIEMKTLPTRSR